ncbi:MAG: DUF4263 domain-containing protein, partial [Campylobacterota bacterium]|nr:DUF4263 domain-containing protein [Campylobacterota bacterium]
FHRSSESNKYIPRLTFRKVDTKNQQKEIEPKKDIIIAFEKGQKPKIFWEFIGFLMSFKHLVDIGQFENKYKIAKTDYLVEFNKKDEKEKFEDIKELIEKSNFSSLNYLKELEFIERKKNLKAFLYLLKNHQYGTQNSFDKYKEKYKIKAQGHEIVWQHFLLHNKWLLGLNTDIRIIQALLSEQDIGIKNSEGNQSPKVDFVGFSNYTTLIEVKTSKTPIFKENKTNKSRTNTWDFSSDFIEGISQCLGQKIEFELSYKNKDYINDGNIIDKNKTRTLDAKIIFLIGNRNIEFPHNYDVSNILKSETFERFKQNSKNIEIITFDELFERAYYIIFNKPPIEHWFSDEKFENDFN